MVSKRNLRKMKKNIGPYNPRTVIGLYIGRSEVFVGIGVDQSPVRSQLNVGSCYYHFNFGKGSSLNAVRPDRRITAF